MIETRNSRRPTSARGGAVRRRDEDKSPDRDDYWFAQKRYGYGAVPVTWQGWLSVAVYLAIVALCVGYLPGDALRLATLGPVTIGYLVLIANKTDGGLVWRWGRRDD